VMALMRYLERGRSSDASGADHAPASN
jgi:hypothetical protein